MLLKTMGDNALPSQSRFASTFELRAFVKNAYSPKKMALAGANSLRVREIQKSQMEKSIAACRSALHSEPSRKGNPSLLLREQCLQYIS